MATITAGDYAVEFLIPMQAYIDWYRNEYKGVDEDRAPGLSLKRFLIAAIEEEMNKDLADRKKRGEDEDDDPKEIIVADVVFAFNNHRLIKVLRKRGGNIAAQNFDAVRETEKEVNTLIQENFDELTRPTAAFITFDNDLGKILAENAYKKDKNRKLLGMPMKFKQASEPTDIIWENRHLTKGDIRSRELVAFLIIGFLLFLSFLFIFKVSRVSAGIAKVFPAVSCEAIEANYGKELQRYAVEDYDFVTDPKNAGLASSGALKCFCKAEIAADMNGAFAKSYGHAKNALICWEYQYMVLKVFVWLNSLKYFITGVNFFLRTICILLVDMIGYKTETLKLINTTKVTFIVQFFNTAFLLLLVNANLKE